MATMSLSNLKSIQGLQSKYTIEHRQGQDRRGVALSLAVILLRGEPNTGQIAVFHVFDPAFHPFSGTTKKPFSARDAQQPKHLDIAVYHADRGCST